MSDGKFMEPELALTAALHRIRELEARHRKLELAYANRQHSIAWLEEKLERRDQDKKKANDKLAELEARCESLELIVKVLEADKQTRNDALDHERARIAAKDEALKEIAAQAAGSRIVNIAREALKR